MLSTGGQALWPSELCTQRKGAKKRSNRSILRFSFVIFRPSGLDSAHHFSREERGKFEPRWCAYAGICADAPRSGPFSFRLRHTFHSVRTLKPLPQPNAPFCEPLKIHAACGAARTQASQQLPNFLRKTHELSECSLALSASNRLATRGAKLSRIRTSTKRGAL